MPVFNYKGIDEAGKDAKGIIDAESEKAARSKLRKTGVFPTLHELTHSHRQFLFGFATLS